jgi:hypothetical protein
MYSTEAKLDVDSVAVLWYSRTESQRRYLLIVSLFVKVVLIFGPPCCPDGYRSYALSCNRQSIQDRYWLRKWELSGGSSNSEASWGRYLANVLGTQGRLEIPEEQH